MNGGDSWERVLFVSDSAGAVDLSVNPRNPDELYAAIWQVYRTAWGMFSGGPYSGLYKSTDGGQSWDELSDNPGMPAGPMGKLGVSVSPVDPNRVWAIIEADSGGVFLSEDAGATWRRTSDDRNLRQRAFYYTRIYADPQELETVYVLNVGFHKSMDNGESFRERLRPPHGDNHDLWIDPYNNQRMANTNDGGGNVSVNGGQTWTGQDYPTAQLYRITTTNHEPYWVCGAQQDNSTACMPSSGWRQIAEFTSVGGGESGYIASDPEDPNVFYAGNYGGSLTRYDYTIGTSERINVWPENPMGHSSEDITERFQWTFPIIFSRTGPKRLYVGSQHLWMSTTEGKSWERLSPDLTRADPATLGPSGGPITLDQTGVETYATIFAVAPGKHDGNTIWVGSDDGLIHITRDHGANWADITPANIPEFSRISDIEESPHVPGRAWVSAKRYQLDDRLPYIYRTDDYGRSWHLTVMGIADGHYVHAVAEDVERPGLLFAATEHMPYVSFDYGQTWAPFARNLPDTQISDVDVKGNDVVISTHGRSAFIMDDITTLRQVTRTVVDAPAHLFDPVDPVFGQTSSVEVGYYLGQPADEVVLELLDAQGQVLERASSEDEGRSPDTDAGASRYSFNLRHEGITSFPGMIMWSAGTSGPGMIPGEYAVRLRVNSGQPLTQGFTYRMDPRFPEVTMADHRERLELALRVRDRASAANQGVINIRALKEEVDERIEADAAVREAGERFMAAMAAVEEELYQVRLQSGQDPLNFPIKLNNKMAALLGAVEGVHGAPTAQSYEVYDVLAERIDAELERLESVLAEQLPELNRLLRERGLDAIERPAPIT